MKDLENEIKNWAKAKRFDIKTKAEEAFNYPYPNWNNDRYINNSCESFNNVKADYEYVTRRSALINLYEGEGLLYEAFLCTMIWGNIGLYNKQQFIGVFTADKDDVKSKLENVKNYLIKNDIKNAYTSMLKNANNYIKYLGPAFFSKYLYFVSKSVNLGNNPKPLIYDSVMINTHKAILLSCGKTYAEAEKVTNNDVDCYIDLIIKMKQLSDNLGLEADKLEALLFTKGGNIGINGREFIKDYISNKKSGNSEKKQQNLKDNSKNNVNIKQSENFWDKLKKRITYIGTPSSSGGFCKLKGKYKDGVQLRINVFKNDIKKNGYQSISITHGPIWTPPQKLKDEYGKMFDESKKGYLVIRNTNPMYADENKKIEWFVENINKIIEILK